jgi:hypothetical protein
MSDGGASYPSSEVQSIQNSQAYKAKKIKFSGIGYGGSRFEVLEQIANALGGSMEFALKAE